MESSEQKDKEQLLRMILKLKKKRKPKKVISQMNIDGKPSVLFPENTNSSADYWNKSEGVRESLRSIIKNS